MSLSERVIRLGGKRGRVAVLTGNGEGDGASVVLLNAGWLHHVGPNRLHVRLARHLAEEGHGVLRLDFSGVGDSPAREDGLPRREANLAEGVEAVEFLCSAGGDAPVVVGGLCSGADAAYRIATEDERVSGAFFLDGFPYRTPGWYLRHYSRRALRPGVWKRLLSGGEEIRASVDEALASPAGGGRDVPPVEEAREGLRRLVKRGARLLFVYTGGMTSFYNHEGQFGEIFPGLGGHPRVTTHFLEDADHIFTFRSHQRRLVETMGEWLSGFRAATVGGRSP